METSTQTERRDTQATESEAQAAQKAQGGCCGGAAPKGVDACCALDAEVKTAGGSGCGCAPKAASGATAKKGCC